MSGGMNQLFKSGPQQFSSSHPFNTQPDPSLAAGPPGVRRLNLVAEGTCGAMALTTVKKAPEAMPMASHAFNAYYLPYQEKAKPSVQLGTDADYFFTAAITGCRLIIGGGGLPVVTHVDGGFFNDQQMDAMCSTRANGTNSTSMRYWDNGEYYATIVVGVRNGSAWKFFAQSYQLNSKTPLDTQEV